jgi:hypothetical protein
LEGVTPGPLSLTESCREVPYFTDDRCGYGRVFAETNLGTKSNPPADILGVRLAMGSLLSFRRSPLGEPKRPAEHAANQQEAPLDGKVSLGTPMGLP